jgi:hypothetical protein
MSEEWIVGAGATAGVVNALDLVRRQIPQRA